MKIMKSISDNHLWHIEECIHQGQHETETHKPIGLLVQMLPMAMLRIVLLLQLFSSKPSQPAF